MARQSYKPGMSSLKKHRPRNPLPRARPFPGPRATAAHVSRARLVVDLDDGRTLIVPLALIPGFDGVPRHALAKYELVGGGVGIHFPDLDEDVSVANLLHPEATMWPRSARTPRTRRSS